MLYTFKKGFTLVELIVVITILSILATIAFTSFLGYQKSARESTRISDVHLLEKVLSIYIVSHSQYPLPDNYITITASGTTIGYQGDFGTGALIAVQQAGDIKDPLDGEYYSYFVDASRQSTQMMALMERQSSLNTAFIPGVYASPDYSSRYPKVFGKPLGMLTKSDNTPLHQTGSLTTLDTVNYVGPEEYTAYFSDTESISGTGLVLRGIAQDANCSRITEFEYAEDGIYTINPKKMGSFQVYCETTIDGGGWMLIARTIAGATGSFGWLTETGSISDNSTVYSLGDVSMNLGFDEIMLTTYSSEKNIDLALKVSVDSSYIGDPSNHSYKRLTSNCTELYPTTSSWRSACDGDGEDGKVGTRNFARSWGWLADTDGTPTTKFTFRNSTHSAQFSTNAGTQLVPGGASYGGITVDGYTEGDCANGSTCSSFGEFGGRQGMIFVR